MLFSEYKHYIFVVLFILFFSEQMFGQSDTSVFTPFSKGRSLVSLNGSISSVVNNQNQGVNIGEKVLNNYLFEIRLAKILARNFAFGLAFTTEKFSSQQLIQLDTEVLTLGPWGAYYFTKGQSGGLFIHGALLFVNYYERNQLLAINPPIDNYSMGRGFGGAIGFGYTYVMFDIVGLEVSMNLRQARIYGNISNYINQQSTYEVFNRTEINFKFGFIVLFNKLKND